jgi:hypothetical protein
VTRRDGDQVPLQSLIESEEINEYVREAAIDAFQKNAKRRASMTIRFAGFKDAGENQVLLGDCCA